MLIERSRDPEPVDARARAEFRNRKLCELACGKTLGITKAAAAHAALARDRRRWKAN